MKAVITWKLLSVMLAAALLSGCALKSIQPYTGGDYGLVIMATEVSTERKNEIWYDYIFTVRNLDTNEEQRMRIAPRVGDTYEYLGQLPAGNYIIDRRESIAKSGSRVYPRDMSASFAVEAGKVTLQHKLTVSSRDNAQYFSMNYLGNQEVIALFENELQSRDDFDGWELKQR